MLHNMIKGVAQSYRSRIVFGWAGLPKAPITQAFNYLFPGRFLSTAILDYGICTVGVDYWNIQKFMTKILSMGHTWQNFRSFTEDEIERITDNYGIL
jgi:hypothetical protein